MEESKPNTLNSPVDTVSGEWLLENLKHTFATDLSPGQLAMVTDADGTLWSGDIGVDFLQAGLRARLFRADALEYSQTMAKGFSLALHDDCNEQLKILDRGYEEGKVTDEAMVHLCAAAFAGLEQHVVEEFAENVVAEVQLSARLHQELSPIFAWAQTQKIPIRVVSASPREIVVAGAKLFGILSSNVVGVEVTTTPIELVRSTQIVEPIPYGAGKRQAIEARFESSRVLAGFGDNYWDTAMLAMAQFPIAIRPKPRLLANLYEVPKLKQLAQ